MDDFVPSLTEYAVLGLLAEGRRHGFALSKELGPSSEVGRILTVRRPLVYRALDRLVGAGLAQPIHTEPGAAGPNRVIHRITPAGRRRLTVWLQRPVAHIRDMRIEFQLKLGLLQRSGASPLDLIRSQRIALRPTLDALDPASGPGSDHVELWRRHNAAAVDAYLSQLEAIHRG